MANQLTPEEIEEAKLADEQAKAEAKSSKSGKNNQTKNEEAGIIAHPKHEHKVGNYSLTDLVTFKCEYKEGYAGKKHLKEGVHKIHRLTAQRLQTKGVGKIVE
jgi:hypothetical protein